MPRVSQDHLDARRRQILDAARRCFVRNGFHATSMQDVLTEANLSAGAVYRYFRGKDEIIAAIATEAMTQVVRAFEEVADGEAPPTLDAVLERVLETIQRLDEEQGLTKLAVQVWGEAVRDQALAAEVRVIIGTVLGVVTKLVERYQERGLITRDVPADQIARVLAGLVPGFIVQRALLGDVNASVFRGGLRALLATPSELTRQ